MTQPAEPIVHASLVGRPAIDPAIKTARAQRLRALRLALGMTQEQVQRGGQFRQGEVSQLESKTRGLTGGGAISKLAEAFNVDQGSLIAYLIDEDLSLAEIVTRCKPGVTRAEKPPWETAKLRTNDARPALAWLYQLPAEADFIRGFEHWVNHVGGTMGRKPWKDFATKQLAWWGTVRRDLRDKSLAEWLKEKRPPIDAEIARTMRMLYPPGIPIIAEWDDLFRRLVGLRAAARRRRKKSEPDVTAEEMIVLLLEDAA